MSDTLGPECYAQSDSGLMAYCYFDQLENLSIHGDDLVNDVRDLTVNANHGNGQESAIIEDSDFTIPLTSLEAPMTKKGFLVVKRLSKC